MTSAAMSTEGTVQEEGLVKAISESWAAVIQEIEALREDLDGGDLTAGLTGKTSERIKTSRLTANELRDFEGLLAKVFSLDAEATVHELAALRASLRMARVSGSTYYTIQHLMNLLHSSGWISGGTVTDGGSGTIDVTAGTGLIRAEDSDVAELLFFNWAASVGIAVPTDTTRYIGVEYNSGSPQVVIKSSIAVDGNTEFLLATVVNEGDTLHLTDHRDLSANVARELQDRLHNISHITRADHLGGLILGETGTRNLTMSTGTLWNGLTKSVISALDTSGADRFDRYYRDGSGGFTKEAVQSQWNNTQYDDGDGGLATLTNNRWAAQYFYLEFDGGLVSLYGQAQYVTEAQALDDTPPATVPDRVVEHGFLIGRLIFQKNAATGTIETVFDKMFGTTGVTDHVNLANIGTNTHAQIDTHISSTQPIDLGGTGETAEQAAIDALTVVSDATDEHVLTKDTGSGNAVWKAAAGGGGGVSEMDDLDDADTTTDPPNLNEVLKWDGSNWVPGTAGDTTEFTFSIDSFSDGISDTSQLIGDGVWKAIGAVSFTATYSNVPGGMTAEVALAGSATPWAGNLSMTPVTGPETNTEAVEYPSSATGTITFTLSQSADGSEDTESVSFANTMRYGTNVNGIGAQTEVNIEALSEVSGPNESRSQTISNIATDAGNELTFAYADRLSDVAQVQMNSGFGYVTASFNATATTLAPAIQTSGLTTVTNSATFVEAFAAITSRLTDLTNGTNDFKLLTSSTAQNYLYWGELNKASSYTEADVEDNTASQPGQVASNSISSRSMTVNAAAGEYTYIAYPARLGALSSIIIGGFDSIDDFNVDNTALAITNDAGYTENYRVYVSVNHSFTDPTTMTVSL